MDLVNAHVRAHVMLLFERIVDETMQEGILSQKYG